MSPDQLSPMQGLLWHPCDTEGSSNSEGSHATGDSGRYSHDETEMSNLSSGLGSCPPSLTAEVSGSLDGSEPAAGLGELLQDGQTNGKVSESEEVGCCHQEAQSISLSAPSLQVCGPVAQCV